MKGGAIILLCTNIILFLYKNRLLFVGNKFCFKTHTYVFFFIYYFITLFTIIHHFSFDMHDMHEYEIIIKKKKKNTSSTAANVSKFNFVVRQIIPRRRIECKRNALLDLLKKCPEPFYDTTDRTQGRYSCCRLHHTFSKSRRIVKNLRRD